MCVGSVEIPRVVCFRYTVEYLSARDGDSKTNTYASRREQYFPEMRKRPGAKFRERPSWRKSLTGVPTLQASRTDSFLALFDGRPSFVSHSRLWALPVATMFVQLQ